MTTLTIENKKLRVKVSPFGAEIQSIVNQATHLEYLWQANPAYWPRHAPVLFPIVGRLPGDTLQIQDQDFPMKQHGFARDSLFELTNQTEESLQFRLIANEATKKQYPYDFELIIDYTLRGNTVTTRYTIRNPHTDVLPASIGAHPAFNWPLIPGITKEDHTISFSHEETAKIRQLDAGLLLSNKFSNPIEGQTLALQDHLFENDALIFDQLKSRKIQYKAANSASIEVIFDDFPHLGIWTKPGAPFICLEPWQGYSSPVDVAKDFLDKPGLLLIQGKSEVQKGFDLVIN